MENMGGEVRGKGVAGTGETELCALLMLHCTTFKRKDISDQKWGLLEPFSERQLLQIAV